MDPKNFRIGFGKYGTSASNLLNDLSEGGCESLSASTYIQKKL